MASPKVRPNDDGIRMRETPGNGRAVGIIGKQNTLESLESAAETRRKIGIPNEWLRIRKDDGAVGYIGAQYLEAVEIPSGAARRVRCISDGLRIRETAGNGKALGTLALDEVVESLENDDETGRKLGAAGQWLRVRDENGIAGFVAAWFMGEVKSSSAPAPYRNNDDARVTPPPPVVPLPQTKAYVRPREDGLRVRENPRDGNPISLVGPSDTLESLESLDASLAKIGVQGQWLNVRTQAGVSGYVAAWLVISAQAPKSTARPASANIIGVNLDQFHPLSTPDPTRFKGLGWVRFAYNVSMGRGSQDIEAAYSLYYPLAERYARAGIKVMFCFTHQTYGEGRDEFWPWPAMTDDKWRRLTDRYADMINRIAEQYAGQKIVHAWQIWNEQDARIGGPGAVAMEAPQYAHLLGRSIQAIRAADADTPVITGGHTGGADAGSQYARKVIGVLPKNTLPDGIAVHPYGRGANHGSRYTDFGYIRAKLNTFLSILPGRPVWLSEWGALDSEDVTTADSANYAVDFADLISREYEGRVASLIWSAWAMQNGQDGNLSRDNQLLPMLYDRFLGLRG